MKQEQLPTVGILIFDDVEVLDFCGPFEVFNQLEFHPATPDHWHDLEALFGERGAYGNCWCMWWRMKRSEFD
jgi:hypothetical protein